MSSYRSSQVSKKRSVKIGHINTRYLLNKVHEISLLLQNSEIDIFGVSESHLQSSHDINLFEIPSYTLIRKDADNKPGHTGLCVYFSNSIGEYIRRRPEFENNKIESIWLELKTNASKSLLIGFIYRHPNESVSWYDEFNDTLDLVCAKNNNVILLGDFNIDLNNSVHPSWDATKHLFNLKQIISKDTRTDPGTGKSSLLDHIYTNSINNISDTSTWSISFSDHNPICCSWKCVIEKQKYGNHKYFEYRSMKNFCTSNFLFDLYQAKFDDIYYCTDPDVAIEIFYDILISIIEKHAPLKKRRIKQRQSIIPEWLSYEIRIEMAIRDQLRKQNSKSPEYKKQRNKVLNMVRKAKKAYFKNLLESNSSIINIWKVMNSIINKRKNKFNNNNNHSADSFNDHFINLTKNIIDPNFDSTEYKIPDALNDFCKSKLGDSGGCEIPEMKVTDVIKYIKQLKNTKACGIDRINSYFLKLALPYIANPLTFIYNLFISTGVIPDCLKIAKVIPVPKNKDTENLNNFRPISLLSILTKPFEKHLQKVIYNFIETHNLFHDFQCGFRQNHSYQL